PKLIICDEPVSALDVSIQSQILNLLNSVQDELDLTYIFISHALNVVRHVSDTICVMYLGKVMEIASAADLFENAKHPYTEALLSAIPIPDPTVKRDRIILKGDIPSPQNPPSGCRFHTRCIYTEKICIEEEPVLQDLGNGSFSACHFCEEFRTKKENMNE
ncbi:MAG: ABC transporter ATP-binding protein, partial [Eubacteriales bacterium]|nr:ABC transporter ATP-binding protein [Eubacteriales bacterium]